MEAIIKLRINYFSIFEKKINKHISWKTILKFTDVKSPIFSHLLLEIFISSNPLRLQLDDNGFNFVVIFVVISLNSLWRSQIENLKKRHVTKNWTGIFLDSIEE